MTLEQAARSRRRHAARLAAPDGTRPRRAALYLQRPGYGTSYVIGKTRPTG